MDCKIFCGNPRSRVRVARFYFKALPPQTQDLHGFFIHAESKLTKYYPKNWNAFCWLVAFFWLFVAGFLNYPFSPPWTSGVNQQYHFGFPYLFATLTHQPDGNVITTLESFNLAKSVGLLFFNLVSLVFVIQFWAQRFSLRILFCLLSVTGVFIVILQTMYQQLNEEIFVEVLVVGYFTPIFLLFASLIYLAINNYTRPSELSATSDL